MPEAPHIYIYILLNNQNIIYYLTFLNLFIEYIYITNIQIYILLSTQNTLYIMGVRFLVFILILAFLSKKYFILKLFKF